MNSFTETITNKVRIKHLNVEATLNLQIQTFSLQCKDYNIYKWRKKCFDFYLFACVFFLANIESYVTKNCA